MVSPSSVTTRRTVPCMAGCDGPRLTVIRDDGRSFSSASAAPAISKGSVIGMRVHVLPADVRLAHRNARAAGSGTGAAHEVGKVELRHERLPLAHRIVLAQRVADELRVHEEPLQIRVPLELHAEHVEDVAIPPGGGWPRAGGR